MKIERTLAFLKSRRGMTLIELMVVLTILGLLAALVYPKVTGQGGKAKVDAATAQIRLLEDALNRFEVDNGFFPSTEQGLEALVSKPGSGQEAKKYQDGGYLQKSKLPKDPWGNDYKYVSPGNNAPYEIVSYGADGLPGGDALNADISSASN